MLATDTDTDNTPRPASRPAMARSIDRPADQAADKLTASLSAAESYEQPGALYERPRSWESAKPSTTESLVHLRVGDLIREINAINKIRRMSALAMPDGPINA
ncbi:hypothetical protein [Frondihabitans sp. Leaf304]|uniref:hypothetical protein n=1 Tax=Frondihabitans sp. Leaf304 TaxID=1736329 RepID=UPI0006F1EC0C|nr:hypothetical protein [Frondihabitans sp. Leaf304]KQQ28613.1 hypothetical protein ASF54_08175 [Frondihabitans sp. Leaf304]